MRAGQSCVKFPAPKRGRKKIYDPATRAAVFRPSGTIARPSANCIFFGYFLSLLPGINHSATQA
jgi:hypothetical protein